MSQRIAVITGAAGGVGKATVEIFQREDWYVVGIDRAVSDAADRPIRADLADEAEMTSIMGGLSDLGHVDALVNNAAIHLAKTMMQTTPREWESVMSANVRMAYMATQLMQPLLRVRRGAIVNVSSVHAIATSEGAAAYATSKAALVGLTRASALELAADGIRVNAVLPGAIDTPMLLQGRLDAEREEAIGALAARTPLGRVGRPAEIAEAIYFLANGDRSSFMTGQTLVIDGGALAKLSTE